MKLRIMFAAMVAMALLSSCAKKDADQMATDANAPAPQATGPHAIVHLMDGSKVAGSVVASSPTEMVLDTDNGGERKIPLTDIKSVEYGGAPAPRPRQATSTSQPNYPPPAITTKTYEVPVGSEVSVRTNETIDSARANDGQTFDAQLTRDVNDANGDLVIPRGSSARIVIKSASKGGRIRGASDLVLDLESVAINGRTYNVGTTDLTKKGKAGMGANKRTAEYTGGGTALGAIIGAIAGGGKGAAIGALAGAGAGAATQIATKGGSIKVPAESVLTFRLDQPLLVTAAQ